MFSFLKKIINLRSTHVLLVFSLFSLTLSLLRVILSGHWFFVFLVWNLFLAFVPWLIAGITWARSVRSLIPLILLVFVWLLFFPNAPYILTDLLHLGKDRSVPVWFDMILVLSYGFTGTFYGFVSLRMIELILRSRWPRLPGPCIHVPLIYLGCFGIYLGRFLRWNSWDVVANMNRVMADVASRFINPFQHPSTWSFTLLFGTVLNLLFWSYRSFADIPAADR